MKTFLLTCVDMLCGGGDVPVDDVTFLTGSGLTISRGGDEPTPVETLRSKVGGGDGGDNVCCATGLGVMDVLVAVSDVVGLIFGGLCDRVVVLVDFDFTVTALFGLPWFDFDDFWLCGGLEGLEGSGEEGALEESLPGEAFMGTSDVDMESLCSDTNLLFLVCFLDDFLSLVFLPITRHKINIFSFFNFTTSK